MRKEACIELPCQEGLLEAFDDSVCEGLHDLGLIGSPHNYERGSVIV